MTEGHDGGRDDERKGCHAALVSPPVSLALDSPSSEGAFKTHAPPAELRRGGALPLPKPPLCKGRWHGEAVTEGLSVIRQSLSHLR